MQYAVAVFGFSLLMGSAVFLSVGWVVTLVGAGVGLLLLTVLLLHRDRQFTRLYQIALAALLIAAGNVLLHGAIQATPAESFHGQTLFMEGELVELPQKTDRGYVYQLKATCSAAGGESTVGISLYTETLLEVEPYDRIGATVTLQSVQEPYRMQSYADGVFLQGYPKDTPTVTAGIHRPLYYYALQLRQTMIDSVSRFLPQRESGVVRAVLLGDRTGMDETDSGSFRASGIFHMVAVSGLHLSTLAGGVFLLLRRLRAPRWLTAFISTGFVLGFMTLTGFSPSVVRSGIMCSLLYLGYWLWRSVDGLNSLCLAAVVLLILNPYYAKDLRFLLSFFATLGLICSPLGRRFAVSAEDSGLQKISKRLMRSICTTLNATLPILPLTAVVFGGISLVSPLSNLVIAPLCTVLLPFAMIGGVLSATPLAQPFFLVSGGLARLMLWLAKEFSSLPFATLSTDLPMTPVCVAAILLVAGVMVAMNSGRKLKRVAALLCVGLVVIGYGSYALFERGVISVTVLDSGNGCSVLIQENGTNLLLGAGGTRVMSCLPEALRGDTPDCLVLFGNNPKDCTSASQVMDAYPQTILYADTATRLLPSVAGLECRIHSMPRYLKVGHCTVQLTETYVEVTMFDRVLRIMEDGTEFSAKGADVLIGGPNCTGSAENVHQIVLLYGSRDGIQAADALRNRETTAYPTAGCGSVTWRFRPKGGDRFCRWN